MHSTFNSLLASLPFLIAQRRLKLVSERKEMIVRFVFRIHCLLADYLCIPAIDFGRMCSSALAFAFAGSLVASGMAHLLFPVLVGIACTRVCRGSVVSRNLQSSALR